MRRIHYSFIAVLSLTGLVTAACSSSGTTTAGGPTATGAGDTGVPAASVDTTGFENVNIPFSADMQVPDPDIFYEVEGNSVTTSVYEGLVRYKPDSAKVEPAAGRELDVSPDGLTYTFKLRPGVKFHDGTPFDSAALKSASSGAPR